MVQPQFFCHMCCGQSKLLFIRIIENFSTKLPLPRMRSPPITRSIPEDKLFTAFLPPRLRISPPPINSGLLFACQNHLQADFQILLEKEIQVKGRMKIFLSRLLLHSTHLRDAQKSKS